MCGKRKSATSSVVAPEASAYPILSCMFTLIIGWLVDGAPRQNRIAATRLKQAIHGLHTELAHKRLIPHIPGALQRREGLALLGFSEDLEHRPHEP